MTEPDFRGVYSVLNDLIDEMCELREAVALFEKQVLNKTAPIPIATVKKPRKARAKKTIQTSSETDSLLVVPPEIPDDKSLTTSCADEKQTASQTVEVQK